jgi:hypothetical protein
MFGVYLPRVDIKVKSLIIHNSAKRMGERRCILGPNTLNLESKSRTGSVSLSGSLIPRYPLCTASRLGRRAGMYVAAKENIFDIARNRIPISQLKARPYAIAGCDISEGLNLILCVSKGSA